MMFPLDVTMTVWLKQRDLHGPEGQVSEKGPLSEWVTAFTTPTFERNAGLMQDEEKRMALHDPLVVWYALTSRPTPISSDGNEEPPRGGDWVIQKDVDVRIETTGEWTRGMCVVDRRGRKIVEGEDVGSDLGDWLTRSKGNRIDVCTGVGDEDQLAKVLVSRIFGN